MYQKLNVTVAYPEMHSIAFDGMAGKPSVSAFQNFFQIENWLNIKKGMGRNVWMCFVLTVSTYIALNAFHTLILCLDSVDIHTVHCLL